MFKLISVLSYLTSAIFIGMGFHKLYVYENDELSFDTVNAYVGGDAYNYIINSSMATAFFVLAALFATIATLFILIESLNKSFSRMDTNKRKDDSLVS